MLYGHHRKAHVVPEEVDLKITQVDPKIKEVDPKIQEVDPEIQEVDPKVHTICASFIVLMGKAHRSDLHVSAFSTVPQ